MAKAIALTSEQFIEALKNYAVELGLELDSSNPAEPNIHVSTDTNGNIVSVVVRRPPDRPPA